MDILNLEKIREMKKQNKKQRKLRKCELGIKTKSLYKNGCRHYLSNKGLLPFL